MAAPVKTFYVASVGGKFGAVFTARADAAKVADGPVYVMRDTRKDRAVKRAKDARAATHALLSKARAISLAS